jgi:hypothetical protein
MAKERDFPAVFAALKSMLTPYADHLTVTADNAEGYSLNGVFSPQFKQDVFFGAAQIKKNYVSFYLMPVYMFPELLSGVSEKLSKRMQGKSCFNFTAVDSEMMDQLAALTKKGFERFQQEKLTKNS